MRNDEAGVRRFVARTQRTAADNDARIEARLEDHIGQNYSDEQDPHGLSAHVDSALIHFTDVPLDSEHYVRVDRAWGKIPPPDVGALYGPTDAFTLTTAPTVLANYASQGESGTFAGQTYRDSGLIIIPAPGIYRVNAWVFGTQGSNTKEETMRLNLRIVNTPSQDGDHTHWAFDVATDKTNERTFAFNRLIHLPQMAFLFLSMSATAGMGTFSVVDTTLEVTGFSQLEVGGA